MHSVDKLRLERDRFVAFSFAAADLLLEVGPTSAILYVSGAAKAVSGDTAEDLIGRPYGTLFTPEDGRRVQQLLDRLTGGGRLEPVAVTLSSGPDAGRRMVLGGCRLPGAASQYYLTLSSAGVATSEEAIAGGSDAATGLIDAAAFEQRAIASLKESAESGKDVSLTLLRLSGFHKFSDQAGKDATDQFLAKIGALLRASSLDGRGAARISDDKYSLLHGSELDPAALDSEVESIARAVAPEASPPGTEQSHVDLSRDGLSEEEAVKSLVFTMASFGKSAGSFTITSLTGAFETLLSSTVERFKSYKGVVSDKLFDLAFQPIVDLASGSLRHFEVLARLDGGRSPYQMVTFAEELGVIEQFDLVVCRRALDYLLREENGVTVKLAVNVSAQSLGSCLFIAALLELLHDTKVEDRLIFEITESTRMQDLTTSNTAIQRLREKGFLVGLDDFGAGSASFPYLQALTVDFVKIDGAYVREVLSDSRSALILKSMCNLCRDLGVYTVGEMVETREQAEKLLEIGVDCGQGYFFGKPGPKTRMAVGGWQGIKAAILGQA